LALVEASGTPVALKATTPDTSEKPRTLPASADLPINRLEADVTLAEPVPLSGLKALRLEPGAEKLAPRGVVAKKTWEAGTVVLGTKTSPLGDQAVNKIPAKIEAPLRPNRVRRPVRKTGKRLADLGVTRLRQPVDAVPLSDDGLHKNVNRVVGE
jgi:hypothetical protein